MSAEYNRSFKSRGIHHSPVTGLSLVYQLVDALVIISTLILSCAVYEVPWMFEYDLPLVLSVLFFYLFADGYNLYQPWRGAPLRQEAARGIAAWILTLILLLVLGFVTERHIYYDRQVIMTWFFMTPLCLGLYRIVFRVVLGFVRSKGFNVKTVAIAGLTDTALRIGGAMENAPWMGMLIAGYFDDRDIKRLSGHMTVPFDIQGNFQEMVRGAKEGKFDYIYITLPMVGEKRIKQLIHDLADTVASVYLVPDFFVYNVLHGRWSSIDGLPLVSVYENPLEGLAGWVKRAEDLVLSLLFLLILALPMAWIALGIRITMGAPVLFRQRRLGLDGEEIRMWKFRTMYTIEDDAKIMTQCEPHDKRVTPIGRFLRATSLDELPQLFNVLDGSMSLVGPRPHALMHNEAYRQLIHGYMLRHKVIPGITGWAQVNGFRGATETLDKMQGRINCDLWYIRNWSIWLDLKIILQTIFKGLFLERYSQRKPPVYQSSPSTDQAL